MITLHPNKENQNGMNVQVAIMNQSKMSYNEHKDIEGVNICTKMLFETMTSKEAK